MKYKKGTLKPKILKEMLVGVTRGCLCYNGRHARTWHCIVKTENLPSTFHADFPFGRPPTKNTGLWAKDDFHKIKGWGKLV